MYAIRSYYENKLHLPLLELNLAIIFMATAGPLGRYITMPVPLTIGFRSVFGGLLIGLFCLWRRFSLVIQPADRKAVLLSGLLMGVHWITYFYALKYSNVSVGMLVLLTFPVITAILEPLLLKTTFQPVHLLFGVMVLAGVYLLVPEFDIRSRYTQALGFGLLSATCYALRNIIIKSRIDRYKGSVLMFYQLLIIAA